MGTDTRQRQCQVLFTCVHCGREQVETYDITEDSDGWPTWPEKLPLGWELMKDPNNYYGGVFGDHCHNCTTVLNRKFDLRMEAEGRKGAPF